MVKTSIVHRDIKEIEWRFLVVEMATKDLKKVRHDVGCFKVRQIIAWKVHFNSTIAHYFPIKPTISWKQFQFQPTKKLLEILRKDINLDTMYNDRITLVDYLKTTYMKVYF